MKYMLQLDPHFDLCCGPLVCDLRALHSKQTVHSHEHMKGFISSVW